MGAKCWLVKNSEKGMKYQGQAGGYGLWLFSGNTNTNIASIELSKFSRPLDGKKYKDLIFWSVKKFLCQFSQERPV